MSQMGVIRVRGASTLCSVLRAPYYHSVFIVFAALVIVVVVDGAAIAAFMML